MSSTGEEGHNATSHSASNPSPATTPPRGNHRAARRSSLIRAPSVLHSALYGAIAGVVFYGGYFVYRSLKLNNHNTEYYARQSRWRHLEKQQLFQRELTQKMNAHFVANLAQEYDPVAVRMPGKPFDPKHLL